jgi:phospholipase C
VTSVRTRTGARATWLGAALLIGALCVGGRGTPAAQAALPTPNPIRHVVVIYQENHSFDEVLGKLCQETVNGHPRCDGSLTARLSTGATYTLTKSPDVVPVVNHDTKSSKAAINGGLMNGFDKIKGCTAAAGYQCLTYYDPTQIPNLAAYARAFAVSDRTFQMDQVPSFGAHIELVAQQLDGFTGVKPSTGTAGKVGRGWGCDSLRDAPWLAPGTTGTPKYVASCIPDYSLDPTKYPYGGAYKSTPVAHVTSFMDVMTANSVSWRFYATPASAQPATAQEPYGWAVCPMFADCLYTAQAANLRASGDILTDARNGTLPGFSLVLPNGATGKTSQHNGMSMSVGDNWIGQVVSAIQNGPDWSSTAIFVEYDDCGCFYDHVPPPQAGLGIRSPVVIISPYARAGFADSNVATTSSLLAFTEHVFGLPPLLASVDGAAYDYAAAFDFTQTPTGPVPAVITPLSPQTRAYLAAHPVDPDDPT